jgi:hypothetical protein
VSFNPSPQIAGNFDPTPKATYSNDEFHHGTGKKRISYRYENKKISSVIRDSDHIFTLLINFLFRTAGRGYHVLRSPSVTDTHFEIRIPSTTGNKVLFTAIWSSQDNNAVFDTQQESMDLYLASICHSQFNGYYGPNSLAVFNNNQFASAVLSESNTGNKAAHNFYFNVRDSLMGPIVHYNNLHSLGVSKQELGRFLTNYRASTERICAELQKSAEKGDVFNFGEGSNFNFKEKITLGTGIDKRLKENGLLSDITFKWCDDIVTSGKRNRNGTKSTPRVTQAQLAQALTDVTKTFDSFKELLKSNPPGEHENSTIPVTPITNIADAEELERLAAEEAAKNGGGHV